MPSPFVPFNTQPGGQYYLDPNLPPNEFNQQLGNAMFQVISSLFTNPLNQINRIGGQAENIPVYDPNLGYADVFRNAGYGEIPSEVMGIVAGMVEPGPGDINLPKIPPETIAGLIPMVKFLTEKYPKKFSESWSGGLRIDTPTWNGRISNNLDNPSYGYVDFLSRNGGDATNAEFADYMDISRVLTAADKNGVVLETFPSAFLPNGAQADNMKDLGNTERLRELYGKLGFTAQPYGLDMERLPNFKKETTANLINEFNLDTQKMNDIISAALTPEGKQAGITMDTLTSYLTSQVGDDRVASLLATDYILNKWDKQPFDVNRLQELVVPSSSLTDMEVIDMIANRDSFNLNDSLDLLNDPQYQELSRAIDEVSPPGLVGSNSPFSVIASWMPEGFSSRQTQALYSQGLFNHVTHPQRLSRNDPFPLFDTSGGASALDTIVGNFPSQFQEHLNTLSRTREGAYYDVEQAVGDIQYMVRTMDTALMPDVLNIVSDKLSNVYDRRSAESIISSVMDMYGLSDFFDNYRPLDIRY